MLKAIFAVAVTLGLSAASAMDIGGVKFEEKVSVGGQDLVLNGGGIRSRFMVKVYAAGLYLPAKSSNAQTVVTAAGNRRLQLSMLRDLTSDQLADALKEGIDNNSSQAELDGIKSEVEQLLALMRGLKEAKSGQNITLDFTADGKTTVAVNGAARGSVGNAALQRALLKIWIGDKPIQNDLKRGLLGQS